MTLLASGIRLAAVLAATLSLTACGRDSGGSGGSASQTPTPTVQIAAGVPTPATKLVTKYISPLGESSSASFDLPPVSAGSEYVLLADDSNDNIVFGTIVSATATDRTFTATSTALTFCRLMQGPLPTGITGAQVNSAIQTAAEFPHLVSLINNAYTAGTLPQDNPDVIRSISLVLSQAMPTLVSKASGISARSGAALANPTVSDPPYTVLSGGPLGFFTIKVTGADDGVKGVTVANGFPIQFAAYGATADGSNTLIPTGSTTGDHYVQLPFSKLYESPNSTAVPGNGKIWNLSVLQTPESRIANGVRLGADIVNTALELGNLRDIEPGCAELVTAQIIKRTSEPAWAKATSGEEGWNAFMERISSASEWKEDGETIYTCGKSLLPNLSGDAQKAVQGMVGNVSQSGFVTQFAPLLRSTSKLLGKAAKAKTLYDIASLGTESWAYWNYWSYATTVGVCESGVNGTTQLGNCAASLLLNPGTASGLVGDKTTFSVSALDSQKNPTLRPQNLVWTSSNPAVASVDRDTGVVTALAQSPSPVTITATEPITGATGTASYSVGAVSASITLTPGSVAVGGTATLSWSSQNATGCTASGSWSGQPAVTGSQPVSPATPGTYSYTLTCNGPGNPATATTALTVTAPVVVAPVPGKTFTYVGANFNDTSATTAKRVDGHLEGTVTFKNDMTGYTGTVDLTGISTFSLNIPGTNFTTTYPSAQLCKPFASDVTFTFENGSITAWYIQTSSTLSLPTCVSGRWDNLHLYTVSNSGGQEDNVGWTDPNGVGYIGDTRTRSPGGWKPAS